MFEWGATVHAYNKNIQKFMEVSCGIHPLVFILVPIDLLSNSVNLIKTELQHVASHTRMLATAVLLPQLLLHHLQHMWLHQVQISLWTM
jgi:hypothetical protein